MLIEKRINNAVKSYKENRERYNKLALFVLEKIESELNDRHILIAYSCCRAKTPESYKEKCNKRVKDIETGEWVYKYDDPGTQIMDMAAVRIVAYLQSDVDKIKKVVEEQFDIDTNNSKDKIDDFSDNQIGYLAMHYIVTLKDTVGNERFRNLKCEIQVKTVLQDAWAQIFHDRQYKNKNRMSCVSWNLSRRTNLVAGALELIDEQIEELVGLYDNYEEKRKEKEYQLLLDEAIDIKTVAQYCKFITKNVVERYYDSKSVMSILSCLKLKKIRDIDHLINHKNLINDIISNGQITIDRFIACILIVAFGDNYFCCKESIRHLSDQTFNILSEYTNMEDLCKKYNIVIEKK